MLHWNPGLHMLVRIHAMLEYIRSTRYGNKVHYAVHGGVQQMFFVASNKIVKCQSV